MNRLKTFIPKILHPRTRWILLLTPISLAAIIITFTTGNDASPLGYISYALSAYTLTVLVIKGLMEIVQDAKIKERYWQNAFKNAYPEKSPTDPDFCVLKFTPTSRRFYSNYQPVDFEI